MNTRWVDASELDGPRTPFWRSPLFFVIVTFSVLLALMTTGFLIYNREPGPLRDVGISDLRADPGRYDGDTVELVGTVEDVRTLPVLDQYGIYNFRDDTGSMLVLTRRGVPPTGEPVRLTGTYHGALELDDYLGTLIEDQFGPLAGIVTDTLVPGIPLNVVFIEHEKYEEGTEALTP